MQLSIWPRIQRQPFYTSLSYVVSGSFLSSTLPPKSYLAVPNSDLFSLSPERILLFFRTLLPCTVIWKMSQGKARLSAGTTFYVFLCSSILAVNDFFIHYLKAIILLILFNFIFVYIERVICYLLLYCG